MAQNNAKNNSSAKSASGKKNSKKTTAQPQVPPVRREIWAVIFLFLSVFLFISFFNTDGAFISFLANLVKGFIGWGVYFAAPAFFILCLILFFHRGKPVALRVTSMLILPVLFAAVCHLFAGGSPAPGAEIKLMVGDLFMDGRALDSGGVFGGLLAEGLRMAFSIYGAMPILMAFFVLFFMMAFKGGVAGIFGLEKKPRAKKYNPEVFEEPVAPAKTPKGKKPVAAKEIPPVEQIPRGKYMADIPIYEDDEDFLLNGKKEFYDDTFLMEETPKRSKGRKKDAKVIEEPVVKPEKAKIQSFEIPYDDDEILTPVKPKRFSAEISDPPKAKKVSRTEVEAEAESVAQEIRSFSDNSNYEFPPLDLLKSGAAAAVDSREEIIVNRERLEGALRSFGIGASIVGVTRGPTVTRYDIELEQGVKLARITNLAGDLALALGVVNVRIAPIPEKISTVGIEVPNKIVSTVYLRDIIDSNQFSAAKSKLSFALGKDIGGDCVVGNISKLPHLLIAGTTGSGKSVCMNSLILSLLYKASPDEVRLIMIDPKMVELGIYNGIPHLFVPVVTDPKKAAGALQWSVVEMLKRYRLFSEKGVRDLASYNKICRDNKEQTMPQVVIVIDELADLMLVASKEVEESICRVAQMGRAAGMHLVIATQRPSADVITGLMKANIPSRIAFAVSSAMESRIILDQGGAEKLVGMGDMLFSPVGCGKPTRLQGAYVSDEEREEVIQFIKESAGDTQQNKEIEEYMNKALESKNSSDGGKSSKEESSGTGYDEMLPQAVEVVLEMGSCSVSMLQRRVKLGYSRAARIVDQMEELGIVGPYEGAKPRQVVIDRAGWDEIKLQLGLVEDSEEI